MLSQSRLKGDGGCFGGDGGSTDDLSTPLASSCHPRANQSNSFIMKSLVSFARSSQARAFARLFWVQHSGRLLFSMISSISREEIGISKSPAGHPAVFDYGPVRPASVVIAIARSSRRGAAGFRLVQKMAASNNGGQSDQEEDCGVSGRRLATATRATPLSTRGRSFLTVPTMENELRTLINPFLNLEPPLSDNRQTRSASRLNMED